MYKMPFSFVAKRIDEKLILQQETGEGPIRVHRACTSTST